MYYFIMVRYECYYKRLIMFTCLCSVHFWKKWSSRDWFSPNKDTDFIVNFCVFNTIMHLFIVSLKHL
jgi:hypothetical protein